jgi:hypothetical protein
VQTAAVIRPLHFRTFPAPSVAQHINLRSIAMANALALVALLVAGCAALASATTYNVGDGQAWTTGVDYTRWARNKAFVVGDRLGECVVGSALLLHNSSRRRHMQLLD